MKIFLFSLLIFHSALIVLIKAQVQVQTLPSGCLTAFRAAALHWHNMDREMHQNTADLAEDPNLDTKAQAYANTVATKQMQTNTKGFAPDPDASDPDVSLQINVNSYQNQVSGAGLQTATDCSNIGTASVASLYSEIQYYNFNTGPTNFNQFIQTGHFTQMVWKSSTTLGMGLSWWKYPDSNNAGSFVNNYLVIYYYSPAGNNLQGCSGFPCNNFPTNVQPVVIPGSMPNMPATTTTSTASSATSASSSASSPSTSPLTSSPSTPSTTSSTATCQNLAGYDSACNYFVTAGFNYCTNPAAYLGGYIFMTACVKACGYCTIG